METWVIHMCRQQYIHRLIACGIFLAVGIAFLAFNTRYIVNFFGGPYAMTPDDLQKISDVNNTPHYFVSVTGVRATDTGLRQFEVTEEYGKEVSRREAASIYGLEVGDRLLIVQASGDMPLSVEGVIAPLPDDIDSLLFDTPEMQASRGRFYPFYLRTGSFRTPGYIGIGVAAVVIILLLVIAIPAWRGYSNPTAHKAVARVASWGNPDTVSAQMEHEHRQPHLKCGGGWKLTENYLIRSSYFIFNVLRFDDLLWAYKHVTKHSVNFIPAGKTYSAFLIFRDGKAEAGGSQKKVDAVLQYASERAPWAIFGYTNEIAAVAHHKRDELVAAVEARRKSPPQAPQSEQG